MYYERKGKQLTRRDPLFILRAMKPELIPVAEAQKLLGVSHTKIWQLLKDGTLKAYKSPLNKRVKLVKRADIERLRNTYEEAA